MRARFLSFVFVVNSLVAVYLLWVIGFHNGFEEFGSLACSNGSVRSDYTTLKGLDDFLCVLVSFFEAAGSLPITSSFLIEFGGLLATMVSIIYLESYHHSNSVLIQYSPLITGLLFQSFGAGIIIPLWMTLWCILPASSEFFDRYSTGEESNYIRTIFPSIVLAFFLPSALLSNGHLSKHNQQSLSATWQLFPLWISILQPVMAFVLYPFTATSTAIAARKTCLTNLIYLNTFLHYYSFYKIYQVCSTSDSSFLSTLISTYYISIDQHTYPGTAHLFLLFDYFTVFTASVIFVLFTPTPGRSNSSLPFWKLLLGLILRFVLMGPGAAVAWVYRAKIESEKGRKKGE